MQILLLVLTIIGVLAVTLLVAAAIIKKEYLIERDVVINKPNDEVFNYVKFIRNQDQYSKWVRTDPQMKKFFKGTDGTVGFIYGWNGNNKAGEGEQEITRIVNGQQINCEVRFVRPFVTVSHTHMITTPVSGNQTKVTWGMVGKSKYPLNVMNGFLMGMLGKDLEESLDMLKAELEKGIITHSESKYANAEI